MKKWLALFIVAGLLFSVCVGEKGVISGASYDPNNVTSLKDDHPDPLPNG